MSAMKSTRNGQGGRWTRLRSARTALGVGAVGALGGFTVVEMLLVVAIIALMTVGVAQVFRVTGETLKAGKRVSNLTQYAAAIEKQIRSDFAALSRDGFMVIRHSTMGNQAPQYDDFPMMLAPGDANPRTRRGDEMIFFITGDFTSKRDPVHPLRQAKATQARVYYGHGLRKDPAAPNYYDTVQIDDENDDITRTPKFGAPGPNRYASDLILLRHETLLCQPSSIVKERLPNNLAEPNPVYQGTGDPNTANVEDLDSDIQIDLQPAASSVLRFLQIYEPSAGDPRFLNTRVVRDDARTAVPLRPRFESGVIDVATTDLSELRAFILDAQPTIARDTGPRAQFLDFDRRPPSGSGTDDVSGSYFLRDANPTVANSSTRLMQAWMRQAFPANSDQGVRMRCESRPPDFTGALGSTTGEVYTKEYQRTDQNMLSASNFVTGCTEFIVEWSFGKAYALNDPQGRAGQLYWHGLRRDGAVTPNGQPTQYALPYGDPLAGGLDEYHMPYRRLDGTTGYWPPLPAEDTSPETINNIHLVRIVPGFSSGFVPEYSYFGYVDPTYRVRSLWTDLAVSGSNPAQGNGVWDGASETFEDLNKNGRRDAGETTLGNGDMWFDPNVSGEKADPREPAAIPWPWPKLVRITMSIADPADPLREQTFQFVVEVPEAQREAPPQ